MLLHLSFWPWIIGAVVSLVVAVVTIERPVGGIYISPGLALYGSGAVAVILAGLIEASGSGLLVGKSIWDILEAALGLGLFSLISSFAASFPAALFRKSTGPDT